MAIFKRVLLFSTFIFFLYICVFLIKREKVNIISETSEWKEVPQGYAIKPDELVQMNLKSGKNYVKKIKHSDNPTNHLVDTKSKDIYPYPLFNNADNKINSNNNQTLNVHKSSKVANQVPIPPPSSFTKEKFRSIDELKKEFGNFFDSIKSDNEIMKELFSIVSNTNNTLIERTNALDNLEPILSDVDNAINFIKINGYSTLLNYLNESLNETCKAIAKSLFAASQNNLEVQIHLLKINAMDTIINMLTRIFDSRYIPSNCVGKMISAFSAMLRGCVICFRNMADDVSRPPPYELLKNLLTHKDYKIRHKIVYMLISMYHSTLEKNTEYSTAEFNIFMKKANLCLYIMRSANDELKNSINDQDFFTSLNEFLNANCFQNIAHVDS